MSLFPPLKPAAARPPCLIGSTGRRRLAGPLAVLVLCCLAVFSAAGAEGAETPDEGGSALAAVVLDIRSHPGDKTDWQALGRSLVRLKAGDRLTAASLNAALAALAACKRFEYINADSVDTQAGPVLTFTLTPFRRIKAIHIQNAAPLFARDIRNRLSIHTGGPLPEGSLTAQAAAVEALYREEGFATPRVEALTRLDPADGHYRIRLIIDPGVWYRLGELSFEGNR
ncbi:MAG: hypothetical protein MUF67_12745, partial [Desulfobacterales bacterium]|nr:hypothetical protein [Desulfobacterales bacterium]